MTATETAIQHVTGDLTAEAGTMQAVGDISIDGNVLDNATLIAAGCVTVKGAVEAATINTEKSISISGGILGKQKGRISGGQGVSAKFCSGANIISIGDVNIQVECVQSEVSTRGAVRIPNGVISGGHVFANGGIHCKTLGSPGGAATTVGAGFDSIFDESANHELERLVGVIEKAREIRKRVDPLVKNQKSLTPSQKEKAIELLYEASEVEQRAAADISRMKQRLEEIDKLTRGEIVVSSIVHANVTIRFRGYQAINRLDIKGPVQITLATTQSPAAICITDVDSGKSFYLDTTSHEDPTLAIRSTLARLAETK